MLELIEISLTLHRADDGTNLRAPTMRCFEPFALRTDEHMPACGKKFAVQQSDQRGFPRTIEPDDRHIALIAGDVGGDMGHADTLRVESVPHRITMKLDLLRRRHRSGRFEQRCEQTHMLIVRTETLERVGNRQSAISDAVPSHGSSENHESTATNIDGKLLTSASSRPTTKCEATHTITT
ncbi:hypothetical protein GSD1FS_1112 [Bifidobacterium sp. GSD1FS]|uniref:Uncharacterized protein n=1 Tax=Bifidobacterium canis TaxID=2610880 RepID=A0A7K1J5E3_9BIFI|nr:hypothetical protein [Bifidobacterium canis]